MMKNFKTIIFCLSKFQQKCSGNDLYICSSLGWKIIDLYEMYREKSEVTNKYVHLLHQDMIKQKWKSVYENKQVTKMKLIKGDNKSNSFIMNEWVSACCLTQTQQFMYWEKPLLHQDMIKKKISIWKETSDQNEIDKRRQ